MSNLEQFRELGISESTLAALAAKGFEQPSPIQAAAIPLLLSGRCDVIGQAQTGTGKTAAFGIPIIDTVTPGLGHVQAVILSPTRELAMQIASEMDSLKGERKMSIVSVFGGQSIELQMRKLSDGADVVVGTPGRIMDLMRRRSLDLAQVAFAVLDEADEMLNMGFLEDMEQILAQTPSEKRTLMFSATMPGPIMDIAARFMREYELVSVADRRMATPNTEQICYEVRREMKFDALTRIIDMELNMYGMVFCRTKSDADELAARLNERGYAVEALHGDLAQAQRTKVIERFKRRKFSLLIATDVAARGIDVNDLTHVINYSIPQAAEPYLHRIGRTGRAGKTGKAITFVTPSERKRLAQIRQELKVEIRKEQLPSPADIVRRKKERALASLRDIVTREEHLDYLGFAEQLLEEISTVELVSAILRLAFKKELLPESYTELESDGRPGRREAETGGWVRLFAAAGKMDGFGPGQLLELIREKTGIRSGQIGKVDCFDKFSFINVKPGDVSKLTKAFRDYGPGRAPFMDIAREEDEKRPDRTNNAAVEEHQVKKSTPKRPRKLTASPEPPPSPKNRVNQKTSKKKKNAAPPPPWVSKRMKKKFDPAAE